MVESTTVATATNTGKDSARSDASTRHDRRHPDRAVEGIFSYATFPLIFGGLLVYAYFIVPERGGAALGLLMAIAYTSISILERIFPHAEPWKHYVREDLLPDMLFIGANNALSGFKDVAVQTIGLFLAAQFAGTVGFHLWPSSWPLVAQWILALVLYELGHYWAHRLAHEVDFLWRFHSLHHSSSRLYFLNAARFHPIDTIWLGLFSATILLALGAPKEILLLVAAVNIVHGVFQHSNLVIRLGPLNWIFSGPELHRWHHSRVLEEANTNYGTNLILWDIVFGTRFHPDRDPPEDVGIDEPAAYPKGFLGPLIAPFRWKKLRAQQPEVLGPPSRTAGR